MCSRDFKLSILLIVFGLVAVASAQDQMPVYSRSDVEGVIRRLEVKSDEFKRFFGRALAHSPIEGTRQEDRLSLRAENLHGALTALRKDLDGGKRHEEAYPQVALALAEAEAINASFHTAPLSAEADHAWDAMRADLNGLAHAYTLRPLSWGPTGDEAAKAAVDRLIHQVEDRTDRFKNLVNSALDRSVLDETRQENEMNARMQELEKLLDRLRDDFDVSDQYEDTREGVERTLEAARRINVLIKQTRLNPEADREWAMLRSDLDLLARAYYLRLLPR